jgi:GTP-binding protein
MSSLQAEYLRSISLPSALPQDNLPQFAFIGRSNVGKSSFINTVTGISNLCRSGSTPGVTKKVNLFLVNRKYYFADLPGYGYAKMSLKERRELEKLIFWYLSERQNQFRQIFLLIDAQIGPTPNDLDVMEFLLQQGLPATIVASKIDKLKPSEKNRQIQNIRSQLPPHFNLIPFSSHSGEGKKEILKTLGI